MKRFPASSAIIGIFFAVGLIAAALSCLPDNPYQRFQQLDGTEYRNLRWIYERLHLSPAPVDVAFLGASRTASVINTQQIAAAFRLRGTPADVVNFAIPMNGRNLDWVLARQLFATKRPKLVIIGVLQQPGRYGHPVYKYVASRLELAEPGYLTNVNYPRDILFLPFRQLKLAAAKAYPSIFGFGAAPGVYPAKPVTAELDYVREADGHWRQIYQQQTLSELYAGSARSRKITTKPVLSSRFADVEFGQERHYLNEVTRLAKAHGAEVVFLYIPEFDSAGNVQEADFYRARGKLLDASFLASDPVNYSSYAHLSDLGRARLTAWLAAVLPPLLPLSRCQSACKRDPF